ncbi:hypothetical protein V1509DRAFT_676501 [Lipomyces kononenkoae]
MWAIGNRESRRSAPRQRRALQFIPNKRRNTRRRSDSNVNFSTEKTLMYSATENSHLLDVVRRPISPDVQVEVEASPTEYEQVRQILESEESDYPKLWYDGRRNVAIVEGPPSALHADMAGGLLLHIVREVWKQHGLSDEVKDRVAQSTEAENTRGGTTRGWDGALRYREGDRDILMIAVEVGLSQAYGSLRAAISWSVCALHFPLGIAMYIREGRRRRRAALHFSSLEEENYAVAEAEEDFRHQLSEHPYRPLVILETYRLPEEGIPSDALLDPSKSFTIVDGGEFVGDNIPPNLREVVLGDCIPDHILNGEAIVNTPVNFFRRDWFEEEFGVGMVRKACNRMRPRCPRAE